MTILRQAREPLAVRDTARRALAAKWVRFPDRRAMQTTRVRSQQYLGALDQRGVMRKVGSGNGPRRVPAAP